MVELDGEAVIYDDITGELHHLNSTATVVFGLCDGTQTCEEMAVDIADAFGMPLDEVAPQVVGLIDRFIDAHLLVGSEPVREVAG